MLDDKRAVSLSPAPPATLGLGSKATSLEVLSQLLGFREAALTSQVGSAMAAAAAAHQAGGGKEAAERAANEVFEANLDIVITMGWANVERYCLDNFRQVLSRVDLSLRPALHLLATLFGIKCILKGSAFFLSSGALGASDLAALRLTLHELYRSLSGNGGRLALRLCDGFGIPEPLITAPIAKVRT